MYLPWVFKAPSNSDIEKRRSRDTAGRLRCQLMKRSQGLERSDGAREASPAPPDVSGPV
jgi:hypothetical protein